MQTPPVIYEILTRHSITVSTFPSPYIRGKMSCLYCAGVIPSNEVICIRDSMAEIDELNFAGRRFR
jgi:hypothetical protein